MPASLLCCIVVSLLHWYLGLSVKREIIFCFKEVTANTMRNHQLNLKSSTSELPLQMQLKQTPAKALSKFLNYFALYL